MGLSCSLGNNHVLEGANITCPKNNHVFGGERGLSCSLGQFKFCFPKDIIVFQGKKGLNFSPMQLKLLIFGDMIVP